MLPRTIEKYLASRAVSGPWKIEGTPREDFRGAVVIPSLAEYDLLFSTLRSLAQNPPDLLAQTLIIVVVNQSREAPTPVKNNNQQTLEALQAGDSSWKVLQLGWIDAASPKKEVPPKVAGVGMARKIGLDLALLRLDFRRPSPLLISLDADTLCRPDYLPALFRHFEETGIPGAAVPFCHQPGETPEQEQAILRYELFLRSYVLGLERAGSPYAFHTVGSAMACTAEAYARIGGMKVRSAGEDFYFLEQLAKSGGVVPLRGTMVYPSARSSNRVPFGTGRSMMMAQGKKGVLFYQKETYRILKEWLNLVGQSLDQGGESIESSAGIISDDLSIYIHQIKFRYYWDKLKKNFNTPTSLMKGFHVWFDALKTMKLIHHLSAGPFPRRNPENVMPDLFSWAGLEPVEGTSPQLEILRRVQNGETE